MNCRGIRCTGCRYCRNMPTLSRCSSVDSLTTINSMPQLEPEPQIEIERPSSPSESVSSGGSDRTATVFLEEPLEQQNNNEKGESPRTRREQRERKLRGINEGFQCLNEIINVSSGVDELRTVIKETEEMVIVLQGIQRKQILHHDTP